MDNKENLSQEKKYLEEVISYLKEQIALSDEHVNTQKKNLVALRKEMFQGGVSTVDDFDRNIEISQYHTMERMETSHYEQKLGKLEQYKRVVDKPYFGRFDFTEDEEEKEKIYIGHQNIMRDGSYEVYVYDWRAPIASMFYRNEIGRAGYTAPCGEIQGDISLKRQYEIEKGELKYFFDSSLAITDDILQQALGHNTSSKMRDIVETIQKEQDMIIRDKGNDLLIVQGVAGSGKTSIAMHRIAYLLYERVAEGLTSDNIMIISPNHLFGEYVMAVLPQLGENNVCYNTMEQIFDAYFKGRYRLRSRNNQLEYMITSKQRSKVRDTIRFKGSMTFADILDGLVETYEKELITFKDVYFDKQLIASREALRKDFLDNPIKMAVGRRLKRIKAGLEKKLREAEKEKRKELIKTAKGRGASYEEHDIEQELSLYRQKAYEAMRSFIYIDYFKLYQTLFKQQGLLKRLAKDAKLPKEIDNMCYYTAKSMRPELLTYEDAMAILYLKLKLEDEHLYPQIKQVLVDEAQDYYPLQYKIFKAVFKDVQYTVLGDIGQTMEKNESDDFYDEVITCLQPKKAVKLGLNKSYRSSYEISLFTKRLRENAQMLIAYERHEEMPVIAGQENEAQQIEWIVEQTKDYEANGYETIAIICKSQKDVNHLYSKLSSKISLNKLSVEAEDFHKGVLIMPIYMAKGLEYDAVIVYEVNKEAYHDEEDKQLLYIACTRALHRLALCYTGEMTPLLKD